jgi:hypothetical protein
MSCIPIAAVRHAGKLVNLERHIYAYRTGLARSGMVSVKAVPE